jgi:hypothetical protein
MRTLLVLVFALPAIALAAGPGTAVVQQPDPSRLVRRIAFGSCSFQSVPQPIYRVVVPSVLDRQRDNS